MRDKLKTTSNKLIDYAVKTMVALMGLVILINLASLSITVLFPQYDVNIDQDLENNELESVDFEFSPSGVQVQEKKITSNNTVLKVYNPSDSNSTIIYSDWQNYQKIELDSKETVRINTTYTKNIYHSIQLSQPISRDLIESDKEISAYYEAEYYYNPMIDL